MTHRPDIDIDLLRALLAVAETGGFTAAAERLNRTQSAVSQKIARLEEQLGWKAFDRNSRGLRLTPRGEALLDRARKLLVQYEHFIDEVQETSTSGTLRLGVSENLTVTRLPDLLARLNKTYPQLRIELSTGISVDLLRDLDAGQLDVVVAKQRGGENSRHGRVAWREPMVWVAATSYRENDSVDARLVMMREPCAYREAAMAALDAAGRPWSVACTVGNLSGVEAAVLGGLGVAPQARSFARAGMKILRTSKRWPALPESEVAVFGRSGEQTALVETLVEMLASPEIAARASDRV